MGFINDQVRVVPRGDDAVFYSIEQEADGIGTLYLGKGFARCGLVDVPPPSVASWDCETS